MQRRWVCSSPISEISEEAKALAKSLKLPALVGHLLTCRGISSLEKAQIYFDAVFKNLPDPLLLSGMENAIARIHKAHQKNETICVVSDYDVDGITSTALLTLVFRQLGCRVLTYVPDRMKDGYGFSQKAVDYAAANGATVVITVDSGSTAHKEIEYANSKGIDVVVIDHHEMEHVGAPKAYAFINPLQDGCNYPDKELASVGLSFKFAQALVRQIGVRPVSDTEVMEHLDLVCLGTIADVAPLVGENRILVREGLKHLAASRKVGVRALLQAASIRAQTLDTEHVAFMLGPRINAAGRMSVADTALKLLLSEDPAEARVLAEALNQENRLRQKVEETILKEALAQVDRHVNFNQHRVIVVYGKDWHPGVVGIVAARLAERFSRPSVVVAVSDGVGKGSARSVGSFHLVEALDQCKEWMVNYGGHEAAAGLTIAEENLPAFRDALNRVAEGRLTPEVMIPKLSIDAEMDLGELTAATVRCLEKMGPFGAGNPRPILASHNLLLKGKAQSLGKSGIRCWVRQENGPVYEATGFDRHNRWRPILTGESSKPFSLAYAPSLKRFQGREFVQLQIQDVQPVSDT